MVQESPDGHLDLWAREHYKSTIITFGQTIQDILRDPEVTVGIFSHTRPIAKGFLRQIKRELESNQTLKDLFPDIDDSPDHDCNVMLQRVSRLSIQDAATDAAVRVDRDGGFDCPGQISDLATAAAATGSRYPAQLSQR